MTVTDYDRDLEPGIPGMEESMATFLLLSEMIGKDRLDWRFDPIVLTDKYSVEYHVEKFEAMCQWLHRATERCVISFVDSYEDKTDTPSCQSPSDAGSKAPGSSSKKQYNPQYPA